MRVVMILLLAPNRGTNVTQVELFSLAQFKNPVALTAAGVFNLNRGLITKVSHDSVCHFQGVVYQRVSLPM